MADYWVSNERKYCDFCKCWIADNKPSISFHEGGKRHKLAVTKRLTEIGKQSIKDERAQQKVDQQLRQMEDAAMKAYSGDISRGADMTSRAIMAFNAVATGTQVCPMPGGPSASMAALTYSADEDDGTIRRNGVRPGPAVLPKRAIDPLMPPIDVLEDEERAKRERLKRKGDGSAIGLSWQQQSVESSMWCEAKSEDGHTYYWNVKTNDTVWERPKEGFMTIKEYNRINEVAVEQQKIQLQEESLFMRGNADEIVAKYAREKLKERRIKPTVAEVKTKKEEQESYQPFEEPGWSARPLGQWKTVETETKYEDLQLPEVKHEFVYVAAANVAPEAPVKKFKEKTITSLSDATDIPSTFKKRKGPVNRSARQRVDDD